MEIVVKQTAEADKAFRIAESLKDYFNEEGLRNIKRDTFQNILFGAYIDDEMVGFVTYKELNSDVIELTWIAVEKKYQNKGIGKKIIEESLKQFNKKYKICEVKTLSEMHPDKGYQLTRSFYKQLGFIPLETIYPYLGWKDPCQIFVKYLQCK